MQGRWRLLGTAAIVTAVLLTRGTAAAAAPSAKVKMPAAIKAAFEAAYPNAAIKSVSREKAGSELHYEVESLDGTLRRDLIYRANGTVVEMEEVVANADLPQAVRDAISARYPKGSVRKAERLTRGTTVVYEVQIRNGKRTRQVTLDPSGTWIRTKKAGKP